MMSRSRPQGGWRFAIALASGWIGLACLLTALEVRGDDRSRTEKGNDRHSAAASERGSNSRAERWDRASRAERRAMRRAAREFWDDVGPEDRTRIKHRLRALRRQLPDFSRTERRMILRRALEMSDADRTDLRDRLMKIDDLQPDQRAALERELRSLIGKGSDEMERIERNARRWKEMSSEDREKMRAQMRTFRELSSEERQRLLDEWVPQEN